MIEHGMLVHARAAMCYSEQQFIYALRKEPERRSLQDLQIIHVHLAGMEALSKLRESALQSLCQMVRYERHDANDILYCRGEMASCWYILLSGAVFIDGSMFLPRASFGKRIGGAARRHNECLILEPSEMIVIDYVDGRARTERIIDSSSTETSGLITEVTIQPHSDNGSFVDSADSPSPPGSHQIYASRHRHHHHHHRHHHHHIHNRYHHRSHNVDAGYGSGSSANGKGPSRTSNSSDSSSAYSGSDTMHSVQSSVEVEEVDLTGLMESVVDSDEEEEEEDSAVDESGLLVRDTVRDCLEKDPSDRTGEDIEVLLEFTQHLKAFTNMTLSVRRALVATMVFAVVEKAGTIVMTDGEELDSWSVIINGHVEVEQANGDKQELHLGDSFGIKPTMDKLYHRGVMRTKCDDCQFVCVTQADYYRILHQGQENQRRHEEDGRVVMVTELRNVESDIRKGHIVIRGTPQRLMSHLMEDNSSVDAAYTEDFLLTYRTFLASPSVIANQLLDWFKDPQLRDKVTRVLLLWVNNHFTDFEMDRDMMDFLERFEVALEKEKMHGQLRMLNFACAAKARKRILTLTRPSRDEPLQFSVVGGYDRGFGIFISRVEKGTKSEEIGLKRGDQILEVNGQSFQHGTTYARALEILKSVCHLSITVKSNPLAFQEMLQNPDDSHRSRSRGRSAGSRSASSSTMALSEQNLALSGSETTLSDGRNGALSPTQFGSSSKGSRDTTPTMRNKKDNTSKSSLASSSKSKFNRAFNRFLHKPKSMVSMDTLDDAGALTASIYPPHNSMSNPDLLRDSFDESKPTSEYPEHVLKVYKADQTFKYLLVHKETTAHEVVMLSLQEFGITETSQNFTLCEVTVAEGGIVKQRTLPDQLQNLAERIGLASRYYIKNKNSSETLLPDETVSDLVKEATVNLLQLNPVEVSTQLMVEDFTIFRQIEATEYVDDLFDIKSRYGTPSLTHFCELVNREMMWTISEVVSEPNATKRMRIIKQFIKVARQCKETHNFNSMFAIISGLGHAAVSRLKSTWEKLPTKYQRLFNEMQQLMDPSRNMSRYRNLLNGEEVQPPVIPFYPVVKKDLTFIHLANDSKIDGLVNFEKLRMIAKEVRSLTNMCSAPLDLFSMLELGGQQPSNAMVAMNQLTTGGQNLASVNRRRKKASGVPNPKRMFEEAQMVRRVKAYLKNMKLITDEEKLHAMSLEIEPPSGGLPSNSHNNPALRKRVPSPTPSAASSASSHSHNSNGIQNGDKKSIGMGSVSSASESVQPKFGAASPQAVKKLLSLSEQSRTRPKGCNSTVGHLHNHLLHSASPSPVATRKDRNSVGACYQHTNGSCSNQSCPNFVSVNGDKITLPVDLTAESSSVTSLPSIRKSCHKNTGSVTSTDSGLGFFDHQSCDAEPHISPRINQQRKMRITSLNSKSARIRTSHCLPPSPIHSSVVSLHRAVPVEITCTDSSAARCSGGVLINNRVVLPPSAPVKKTSTPFFVTHTAHEEDDETQVSAV